jgi:hypothetical protein
MLTGSVKFIRVWAITVIGAIVIGAIEVWIPKEVKAPVARAVVMVAMPVVVAMPVGTLRHTLPILGRLLLEMGLPDTRSLACAVASVATVRPGWG